MCRNRSRVTLSLRAVAACGFASVSGFALTCFLCGATLVGCGPEWDAAFAQTQPAATATAKPAKSGDPDREPTPEEVARMIEPNVLGVSCFYDPFNPWIWNEDHTQVRGVKIGAMFLLGPESTGVFGDGIILPKLFVSYRNEQGKRAYKLVKEWSFDVDQAMPFRAKRRTRWGWGYALFLPWGDIDLAGRDVRITVSFKRADGLLISGSKKDFRVPRPEDQS